MLDVVVVGAGAAGIAAARAALGMQCSVAVLEAMDRIGGRCYTDTSAPIPFDHGAQLMAQVQSVNTTLFPILERSGAVTFPAESIARSLFDPLDPTHLADDDEQTVLYAGYATIVGTILEHGLAIDQGEAPDISLAETVARAGLAHLPYRRLILQLLSEVVVGIAPEHESTLDMFRFLRFSPAPLVYPPRDSLYVPSGLGTALAALADGLPISLSTPVASIARDTDGVTVMLDGGAALRARTVVVTASTGAVRTIAFEPALPPDYDDAFDALPMGNAYKAMLSFSGRPFDGRLGTQPGTMNNAIGLIEAPSPAFSVNYFAQQYPQAPTCMVLTCESALADEYEAMGPQAAALDILAQLEEPFPGVGQAWDGRVWASSWRTNPYTRGGLSSALPGRVAARERLRMPIEQQLWFAGEALSTSSHDLLHGAWASGTIAGTEAARASRRAFSQA
jgi:monoamine oxidase